MFISLSDLLSSFGMIYYSILVSYGSVFKTVLLVYKFLQSGYLKYINLFLKLDTVCTVLVKVKPVLWCLRTHTLPHQYISFLSILASTIHTWSLLNQKEDEN